MNSEKVKNLISPVTNRRGFLKGVVGGAAAISIVPSLAAAERDCQSEFLRVTAQLKDTDAIGEPFWQLVKEQFPIQPKKIMLNAANLCPASRMVRAEAARLTDDLDGDVSFQNRAKFDTLREEARQKLAAFMGAAE